MRVVQNAGKISINGDLLSLNFMPSLRLIKLASKNITAVILSVIGKAHPPRPLFSAPRAIPTTAKLPCEQAALYSYRKAQTSLEQLNVARLV